MEKNAEDAVSVEQTNAQIATERVKTEAAAKAKADAEAQLNIEREKAAAAEKARAEVEAKLAAEREKAAATEKAKEEAEAKLAEAQGKTAAAEKARVEAEAKAAEEREKAAAAEKARVEAEAKAAEEREKAAAETKAGEPAAKPAEDKPAAEAQSTQDNKNAVAEKPAKKEQPKTERHADAAEDEESETLAKVGSALLWYIPNRLSDLMDVFTFEVGGGEIGLDLQLTRYAALGAGVGKSYMLGWSVNNQHGVYCQEGWYADILRYRVSENRRDCVSGKYIPFFKMESERVDIDKMSEVGAEDPYAIGIKACCYLNLKFQIHVTELADFVAGIFFIDFKKDDNEKFNWVFSGL